MSQQNAIQRRQFLQTLAASIPQASIGFGSLAAMGSLSAQTATDTRFLICINLQGGNDQSNTIYPISGTEYNSYKNARPLISLAASSGIAIQPDAFGGPPLGLHPKLTYLAQLFNQGQAAILANVGNLVVPLSKTQWNGGRPTVPVPSQVFSHNDQEAQWQSLSPQFPVNHGWMGRTADVLNSTYTSATSKVPMAMSLGPNGLILNGRNVFAYKLTPTGSPRMTALDGISGSMAASEDLKRMYQTSRSNLLERHLSTVMNRAIESEAFVTAALAAVNMTTSFPSTSLGRQLYGVARTMLASSRLGHRRQAFFVQLGGFDFHDNLMERHDEKMAELNAAVQAFCSFLQSSGLWGQSVMFTTSEFGRALQSNGKGADHGWGSHHFVVGGPVRGKRVYGQWPQVQLNGAEDGGNGRLLPTTAVDQYAATLASWFGVSSSDLTYVAPNIGNFASRNLGFLA